MRDYRVLMRDDTMEPGTIAAAQAVITWDLGRPVAHRRRWHRDCYCGLSTTDAMEIAEAAIAAWKRQEG